MHSVIHVIQGFMSYITLKELLNIIFTSVSGQYPFPLHMMFSSSTFSLVIEIRLLNGFTIIMLLNMVVA